MRGLEDRLRLFGQLDENLQTVERLLSVSVHVDGDDLVVAGDKSSVAIATTALDSLVASAAGGADLTVDDVQFAIERARADGGAEGTAVPESLATTRRGKAVRPRTPGQAEFVKAVLAHTLVFGIGPAGTGKTFLAVVLALHAMRVGRVQRIVLSRPAVEAGEKLGFLPGDPREKVDPYLRPLFDALEELMDPTAVSRAIDRGQIEVAPLAYMRGRTLSDSFIVLDEAQNTSIEQIKMFLTRIGNGSRMIACGDVTQIDLAKPELSGLVHAARIMDGLEDIAVVNLTDADVVRHPLVRRIIGAYARARK